jgi:hypothetical protein
VVNINLIDFVVAPVLLPLLLDFNEIVIHIMTMLFAVSERNCKNRDFFVLKTTKSSPEKYMFVANSRHKLCVKHKKGDLGRQVV